MEIGSIFFFQAEDGIRDYDVTGVQTCALPIWDIPVWKRNEKEKIQNFSYRLSSILTRLLFISVKIGRASCRERV